MTSCQYAELNALIMLSFMSSRIDLRINRMKAAAGAFDKTTTAIAIRIVAAA